MTKLEVINTKVDPKEFGIESTRAVEITTLFQPMLDKLVAHEKAYNEITVLPHSPEKVKQAKALKSLMVKDRGVVKRDHAAQKKFFLNVGRFIDSFKNVHLHGCEGIESELANIIKHDENLEAERIFKIQEERSDKLCVYLEDGAIVPDNLGSMDDLVWNGFITGMESTYNRRREAEEALEKQRVIDEQIGKLNRQRDLILRDYWEFISSETRLENFGEWSQEHFDEAIVKLKSIKASAELNTRRKVDLAPYINFMPDGLKDTNFSTYEEKEFKDLISELKNKKKAKDTIDAENAKKAEDATVELAEAKLKENQRIADDKLIQARRKQRTEALVALGFVFDGTTFSHKHSNSHNAMNLFSLRGDDFGKQFALIRNNIEQNKAKEAKVVKEYNTLGSIVEQLSSCGFVDKTGRPLENNIAFVALEEMAKKE